MIITAHEINRLIHEIDHDCDDLHLKIINYKLLFKIPING